MLHHIQFLTYMFHWSWDPSSLIKIKGLHSEVWKTLPYPISTLLVMKGIVKMPSANTHTIFLIQGRNFMYLSILYLLSFDCSFTCSAASGLDEQVYHFCKKHGNILSINLKFKILTSCFSVHYSR